MRPTQSYFDDHVGIETDECILWPFGVDKDGYGVLPVNRRVHRVACELAHGSRPGGMEVGHSCHNPGCFNSRHLSWLTHLENEQAKTAAGRRPAAHNKKGIGQEIEILDQLAQGTTISEVARAVGLSRDVVRRIGKQYR